ncbi:unnamed protein product [Polarella glacialis]|uniref:K Homology domain-containing protein n=1 Tax=Polarella glacialis TaxID=89957 RepID=A0A813JW02_POLGL|nr:unnamed protein product [Polarella glacialis]CAE8684181.1 unnamed protein product [Polarella glacialis]|mmetsp:Transcript_40186/g.64985  ORF Transcript_40186/g.64985 Transcript_40186/m.64985 type:complete len:359 (-) Transcript_40186:52-1128(-)
MKGGGSKGDGKDAGNTVGGGKGGKDGAPRRSPGSTNVSMPFIMKYLAPEVYASAIIGKGGAVIAAIREATGSKIGLTEHGEVYPSTDARVVTVQANTEKSLNEVSKEFVSKLAELLKSVGPSDAIGSEGDLKIKVLVPRAAVGGVIGKGGATIKEIRESSGARVSISEPIGAGPGAEQLVSISGTPQALEYVLVEVNRQVQMLNSEPWYTAWASSTNVVPGGYGGGGGMGGGGYGGGGGGSYASPGIGTMINVAQSLPPYVMEDSRGFALSCVVPNRLVGGLIGRGGAGTKEVQMMTGTKIGIREIPDDPDNRSLNIAGPLSNTCAAYMMMMKRYLDAEAQSTAAPSETGTGKGSAGR